MKNTPTRQQAVRLVQNGISKAQVAQEFDVSVTTINNWMKSEKLPPVLTTAETKSPLEKENEWLWGLVKKGVRSGKLRLELI